MRILIMGSGGIGGYYGARLTEAGNDVVFVARGAHLEALQQKGLLLREYDGSERLIPVKAVRYPAEAGGTFDFILFAVKTYDTAEAAAAIAPVVGPETCVVPIQNGVDSTEDIAQVIPADRVLAGSALLNALIDAPGVIRRQSGQTITTIGEPKGPRTPRVERIVKAFNDAGCEDVAITDDAQRVLWEKFMFLAPIASVNSATGLPTGHILAVPEGKEALLAMQKEIWAVGLATGVNLPEEASFEKVKAQILRMGHTHTVSMQRDFAGERRVELESLAGSVVLRGRQHGVPTPIFSAVYGNQRARALNFGGVTA
jgi:2-dehydropantoate 2-reductase